MTLLLSNEEVEDLLTMPACLSAMEEAYRDLGQGLGVNGVRSEMLAPTERDDGLYALLTMGAVIPRFKVGAVRINSDILSWPRTDSGAWLEVPSASCAAAGVATNAVDTATAVAASAVVRRRPARMSCAP